VHESVLRKEVVMYLSPESNGLYLDCTLGCGGHTRAILENSSPGGKVIGIDLDERAIEIAKAELEEFAGRYDAICGNYVNAGEILSMHGIQYVDGILLDLGVSSLQLNNAERGFSFVRNGPLDMRMGQSNVLTAYEVVNFWNIERLSKIFREFGEERHSEKIARKIVDERKKLPVKTTKDLAELVKMSVPPYSRRAKIHPATRVFQAIRIAVNMELENLRRFLSGALGLLKVGGRITVISFHSLEDRIVKNTFREWQSTGVFEILTKKVITPSVEEVRVNPRARSAKLRAGRKQK